MMALFKQQGGESQQIDLSQTVSQMRQQGMENNQIIASLQQSGYAFDQIFNAMSKADMQSQMQSPDTMPRPQEIPMMQQQEPMMQSGSNDSRIEEIAEALIDQKWQEFTENVKKIIDWKSRVEERIMKIEAKMDTFEANMSNLQTAILGKITDYDKSLNEVGTDVKALEKVFKNIVPTLTESINDLQRLSKSQTVKQQVKEETSTKTEHNSTEQTVDDIL